MRLVWGTAEESDSRTVDTHVRRLRERLGDYGHALETVHRVGYCWREDAGDANANSGAGGDKDGGP